MTAKLLQQSKIQLSPTMHLKVKPNDKKCKQIYLQISTRNQQNNSMQIYAETIETSDFTRKKQNQSILFLKLALQKCEIKTIHVKNMIWEKVVVGKDRADAALQNMMKLSNNKQYSGIVLNIAYPEHIIIVLPKIITRIIKQQKIQKQQEQNKIKKIFYNKQQLKQQKLLLV